MARRPKGNYEAYITCNQDSSVIVLQVEIKKDDKNVMTDTITISYNYNVKRKDTIQKRAAGKLILKHICVKTVNSYHKKMPYL